MKRTLLALLLTLGMASPAFAGTLAGVTMPGSVTVNGKSLTLNGMGLRTKAFIKVYVAGLYLPSKMNDAKAIIAGDTERQMIMHFVRSVGKDKICGGWKDGLKNNTAHPSAELKGKFDTLCGYMADMGEGETMTYTYVPGTGTSVSVKGQMKGTIPGKDFADALFRCWIGPNPPGEAFKMGLVG